MSILQAVQRHLGKWRAGGPVDAYNSFNKQHGLRVDSISWCSK